MTGKNSLYSENQGYKLGVWRDAYSTRRNTSRDWVHENETRFLVEVKSCLVRRCDVSVMEREITIEDPPATFKSFVWQHFGFPAEIINGERVTDKTNTICKHCKKKMPYTAANTSTMQKHLQHHHSSLLTTAPATKTLKGQTTLKAFASLPPVSARATAITRDIGVFIAADMRPFSVVENVGFRRLLHTFIFYVWFVERS